MPPARSYPQQQLDIGWQLQEEYQGLLERRRANRDMLRNMLLTTPDAFSEEEAQQIGQLYPERKRTEGEEEPEPGSQQAA